MHVVFYIYIVIMRHNQCIDEAKTKFNILLYTLLFEFFLLSKPLTSVSFTVHLKQLESASHIH